MKIRPIAPLILGSLAASLLTGRCAAAADLQVYVAGIHREFGILDLTNPSKITFSSIGTTTSFFAGMGFASDGTLYGLDGNTAGHLWSIDPKNAGSTDLGSVGQTAYGAAFGPDGKTMYAIDQNIPGLFYTLAPPSVAATPIGSTGIFTDGLMAFGPDGTLYTDSVSGGPHGDILASVNLKTGAVTPIGTGMNAYIYSGVFLDGTPYGIGSDLNLNQEVYTIDTSTGQASLYGSYSIDPTGRDWIIAAAVRPSAGPEPPTLALGGIAAVALAAWAMPARRPHSSPTG